MTKASHEKPSSPAQEVSMQAGGAGPRFSLVESYAMASLGVKWNQATGFQLEALRDALQLAYPTPKQFWQFLLLKLNKSYDGIAPEGEPYDVALLTVLTNRAIADGWLPELVAKALQDKPNSPAWETLDRKLAQENIESLSEKLRKNIEDVDNCMENLVRRYKLRKRRADEAEPRTWMYWWNTYYRAVSDIYDFELDLLEDMAHLIDGKQYQDFIYTRTIEAVDRISEEDGNARDDKENLKLYCFTSRSGFLVAMQSFIDNHQHVIDIVRSATDDDTMPPKVNSNIRVLADEIGSRLDLLRQSLHQSP